MKSSSLVIRLVAIVFVVAGYALSGQVTQAAVDCYDCKTCLSGGTKVACCPSGTLYSYCVGDRYNVVLKKPVCIVEECGGIGGNPHEVDGEDDIPDPPDPGGLF